MSNVLLTGKQVWTYFLNIILNKNPIKNMFIYKLFLLNFIKMIMEIND